MKNLQPIGCRRVRRSNGERGSYMIESGLCFVVFFIILLGVLDVGRGIYSYNFISAASKEGARYAMVRGSSSGQVATADNIQTQVRSWLMGVVGGDSATVNTTWTPDNKPGSTVTVQVQCPFTPISSLLVSSWTLQSTSKRLIIQ